MFRNSSQNFIVPQIILFVLFIGGFIALPVAAQGKGASCFTAEARATAERTAKVWQEPDPGYDPVLGLNPTKGARPGALPVDSTELAMPRNCVAKKDPHKGNGTNHRSPWRAPG